MILFGGIRGEAEVGEVEVVDLTSRFDIISSALHSTYNHIKHQHPTMTI